MERSSGEASASASAPDDWELDPAEINFQEKIASGAFGDLYKGTYCGQEVAIKILRDVHDDTQQYQEFLQVGEQPSSFSGSDSAVREDRPRLDSLSDTGEEVWERSESSFSKPFENGK